jgi:hypothetical protein
MLGLVTLEAQEMARQELGTQEPVTVGLELGWG